MASADEPSKFLCERCGYHVDHLDPSSPCPECGRSIHESLPEHRTGSAFERRPGVLSLMITNGSVLVRPARLFRRLRADARASRTLLTWNLAASALLIPAVPMLATVLGSVREYSTMAIGATSSTLETVVLALTAVASVVPILAVLAVLAAPVAAAVFVLLWVLTLIERTGLGFYSRRRGWRITPGIAMAVCSHASVGWLMGSAAYFLVDLYSEIHGYRYPSPPGAWPFSWLPTVAHSPAALALLVGLVVFEVLSYIGVRNCRYANVPPASLSSLGSAATMGAMPTAVREPDKWPQSKVAESASA